MVDLQELSSALDAMQRQARAAAQMLKGSSRETKGALRAAQRDMAAHRSACEVVVKIASRFRKSIVELDGADLVEFLAVHEIEA